MRVDEEAALDQIRDYLPPDWKPASSPIVDRLYSLKAEGASPSRNLRRFHLVFANDARIGRSLDLSVALKTFESDLHLYVAESANRRLFIHSGVVGWRGKLFSYPDEPSRGSLLWY